MAQVILRMSEEERRAIWDHLLPQNCLKEEAGFLFARYQHSGIQHLFHTLNWLPLNKTDYAFQLGDYIELSDSTRSRLIKTAHDQNTCLIEFHSHPGPYPAMFSYADKHGLDEFVPHIWWRLKGRPYIAVVVAKSGFDALVWIDSPHEPETLSCIQTETTALSPTQLTIEHWSKQHD